MRKYRLLVLLAVVSLVHADPIAKKLTDGDVRVRRAVAERLVASSRPRDEVARLLIGALRREKDRTAYGALIEHLVEMGEPALPALHASLGLDSRTGGAIVEVLVRIGAPSVDGLVKALPSKPAVRALRRLGAAAAMAADPLAKLLDGSARDGPVLCALAAVGPGHTALGPAVARQLVGNARQRARGAECAAIMRSHARLFLPRLLELVRDPDWSVRREAGRAVAAIGHLDAAVFQALTKRIDEGPDPALLQATFGLLARDRARAVAFANRLLARPAEAQRRGLHRDAVRLLAATGPSAVPHLLAALGGTRSARREAQRQLRRLAPVALPLLIEAVRRGEARAVPFLALPNANEAVPVLIDRLVLLARLLTLDEHHQARSRAYRPAPTFRGLQDVRWALRTIGAPALAPLRKLTKHADASVRRTASELLAAME